MSKMSNLALVEARVAEITEKFWDASEADKIVLRAEYVGELQPALLAAYGDTGSCYSVDPWTAETFAELFKDRNGSRPGDWSYKAMKEWMANIPSLEDEAVEPDTDAYYATDFDCATLEDIANFEEVYGVSAFGQAARFLDIREF